MGNGRSHARATQLLMRYFGTEEWWRWVVAVGVGTGALHWLIHCVRKQWPDIHGRQKESWHLPCIQSTDIRVGKRSGYGKTCLALGLVSCGVVHYPACCSRGQGLRGLHSTRELA